MLSPIEIMRTPASRRSSVLGSPRELRREQREKSLTMKCRICGSSAPAHFLIPALLERVAGTVAVLKNVSALFGKCVLRNPQ